MAPFSLGTRAMYSCNTGYKLIGDQTRICVVDATTSDNSNGVFGGTANSTCECK